MLGGFAEDLLGLTLHESFDLEFSGMLIPSRREILAQRNRARTPAARASPSPMSSATGSTTSLAPATPPRSTAERAT
jgi:hypothetical protein